MTSRIECPDGASSCPKIEKLEERVIKMERNQTKIMMTLYFIAGVVSVSLGVQII